MKKISIIITTIIVTLIVAIMVLAYQIEGVNTTALWVFFLPLVAIRSYRAFLLISLDHSNRHRLANDLYERTY